MNAPARTLLGRSDEERTANGARLRSGLRQPYNVAAIIRARAAHDVRQSDSACDRGAYRNQAILGIFRRARE